MASAVACSVTLDDVRHQLRQLGHADTAVPDQVIQDFLSEVMAEVKRDALKPAEPLADSTNALASSVEAASFNGALELHGTDIAR